MLLPSWRWSGEVWTLVKPAFALGGGVQRDRAAARVLIPAALVVAAALALTPQEPGTWPPLENVAQKVRSAFEQYFDFTRERVAFSINEQGYDHAGEIEDKVVGMLGGPAQPKDTPEMRVQSTRDVLLRGAIRSTYTGYSWVDLAPKNRYLYVDPTHRATRDRVFNLDFATSAFEPVDVAVEYLDEGTSTLFTPGRLRSFSMDLANAVYYNTSGEMFMARPVEPGDHYGLTTLMPPSAAALRDAARAAEGARDGQYEGILNGYSALPAGIEPELSALVGEITAGAASPFDKALAIQTYLQRNMRYTLTPDYPPVGRDFVSYFVLESREGYCSYYASAMAVMARIAGLPSRYVEGYLARCGATGEAVLTGYDAHAWAEIYFSGLGWISFDATSGATGGAPSEEGEPQGPGGEEPDENGENTMEGEDGQDDGSGNDQGNPPEPTPTPEPQEDDPFAEALNGDDLSDDPPQDGRDAGRGAPWVALIGLLILLVIALIGMWMRGRLQKADPARLIDGAKAPQAAMILYRANLTALAAQGIAPGGGEAPEVFAARAAKETDCADYAGFVRAVSASRYGKKPLARADIEAGLRAYRTFTRRMSRRGKLKYAARRVLHGLGSFEQIP